MKWVALMPLRGGSKSIPLKNVKPIAGKPLFAWSLGEALRSGCFEEIYVASDSPEIRQTVSQLFPDAVSVIDRDPRNATDTASTESVMLDFQRNATFDVLCLIQATSPLTRAEDFKAAKQKYLDESLDSLLTAVPSERFYWDAQAQPLNYDPAARPRRQDAAPTYVENGAFYLTSAEVLSREKCRLGGRIGIQAMSPDTIHELDELRDWKVIEELLLERVRVDAGFQRLARVEVLVVDVDGTLTDGGMYYGAQGEDAKKFHTHDGMGLERVRESGVRVCVMTGEDSPATHARMTKLGVTEYFPGVKNKLELLEQKLVDWDVEMSEVAFVGDDLGDLACLQAVGFSSCPADALAEIRANVDYVCGRAGGEGAVREVCDHICRQRRA